MKIYWDGKSKNIIGKRIRELRNEKGWTQARVAELLQLKGHEFSDLTVLRIENGNRFVPDYELKALAELFEVSYEQLLDGKTDDEEDPV